MEMDPNRVYVVNAYTRKVYADFELDIDARQYMRNHLLKECPGPNDDDREVPKIWCFEARGVETTSF